MHVSAKKRSGRRWLRISVISLIVIAVLVVVAEVALRMIIPATVAQAVRDEVGLTADHPVEVELSGNALFHAVTGRVGDLDVHIDEMPLFGDVSGQVDVHVDSIPMQPTSGEMRGARAEMTLTDEQLDPAIALITGGFAQTGTVRDGQLEVGGAVPMFGQEVRVSVALDIGITEGDVVVTPGTLSAAGFELTSEQIAGFAGGVLDPLLGENTICVRDQLPQGVELTDLHLSSTGTVTIRADLSPGILSNPAEQEPGTCVEGSVAGLVGGA